MKLTNEDIIKIILSCEKDDCENCENDCPFFKECLWYFCGEDSEGNLLTNEKG